MSRHKHNKKKKDSTADKNHRYIEKLAGTLFENLNEREQFIAAVSSGESGVQAVVWTAEARTVSEFGDEPHVDWQPEFVQRVAAEARPGKHPLHGTGDIYCLDLSSVFEAAVISACSYKPRFIADVCAAPGGKSVVISRWFRPEMLLCNEAIGNRIPALISNLKRCRITPAYVSGFDSSKFAENFSGCFDLVLVDAPCSGQSLIARGLESKGCFNPHVINMNSNRQKRILANSAKIPAENGYLAYMTCTYSIEENEKVLTWFLKKFPDYTAVEVASLERFRSPFAEFPCYRLFPQAGMGAGGFTAIFKRCDGEPLKQIDLSHYKFLWKST